MANFSREFKNLAHIKQQWDTPDSFLHKTRKLHIEKGDAILAFRKEQATVYYNGNQLCNIAYPDFSPKVNELFLPLLRSAILEKRSSGTKDTHEYIDEKEWKGRAKIESNTVRFADILEEICSNISAHQTPESFLVSKLYKYSPLNPQNDSPIILLDVEAVFAIPGKKTSDRIDLVFYHKNKQQLFFVEAKGLWDKRLRPNTKGDAEIIGQMSRYKKILTDDKEKDNIKDQYNKVIEYYNFIGGLNIPPIGDKAPMLGLLLFGYDSTTKKQCDLNKIKESLKKHRIPYYSIGDTQSVTNKTLEALCKRFNR